MATDGSLSGDGVAIWFAPVDTDGGDLAANATEIQSFITNFNETGGESDVESVSVFGGGNIDKTKPQSQKELTFDVILRHSAGIDNFKKIETGAVIAADGAGPDFVVGEIAIQQSDGTNYYWQAYNNVNAIVFDTEFEAEDEWRGTIKFKLSPTDPNAASNIKFGATNITSGLSW